MIFQKQTKNVNQFNFDFKIMNRKKKLWLNRAHMANPVRVTAPIGINCVPKKRTHTKYNYKRTMRVELNVLIS